MTTKLNRETVANLRTVLIGTGMASEQLSELYATELSKSLVDTIRDNINAGVSVAKSGLFGGKALNQAMPQPFKTIAGTLSVGLHNIYTAHGNMKQASIENEPDTQPTLKKGF